MWHTSWCSHVFACALLGASTVVWVGCENTKEGVTPLAPSMDMTALSKPVDGHFEESGLGRGNPQCDLGGSAVVKSADGNWRTGNFWLCLTVAVTEGGEPVTRGTVEFDRCEAKGGTFGVLSASACEEKGGPGRWISWRRVELDGDGTATAPLFALDEGFGHRWTYKARGSGVHSHRSDAFDVIRE